MEEAIRGEVNIEDNVGVVIENTIETLDDEVNVVMEDNENVRNVTVLEEQKIDFDVSMLLTFRR